MSLNATNLYIQASPLPATFRGTPNDFFAEMIRRMKILSPSGTNFIFIGDTEPTSNVGPWLKNGTQWWVWDPATKQYVPQDITASFTPAFQVGATPPATFNPPFWLQTTQDSNGATPPLYGELIRMFAWDGTRWAAPHPVPPSSKEVKIWIGSTLELWSYDGGDGTDPSITAPTDFTGAMWQVAAEFNFRLPMGVGTSGTTYDGNPATTMALLQQQGVERVNLTIPETPKHRHFEFNVDDAATHGPNLPLSPTNHPCVASTGVYVIYGDATDATIGLSSEVGGDLSHNNLPPVVGVYFIKRTARKYYTA